MNKKDKHEPLLPKKHRFTDMERETIRQYLDIAGVMFIAINADQTVRSINKKTADVLGYSESEIIGNNWFDTFVPEKMRSEVRAVFMQLIAGEISPSSYFENPIITKSGEERLIFWHNAVIKDNTGKIIGALSSGEDITDRKLTEEKLRATHQQYLQVIAQAEAVPYLRDYRTNEFTIIGEGIEAICGYSASEITPQLFKKIIQESGFLGEAAGLNHTAAIKKIQAGEIKKWHAEYRIKSKSGEMRWISDASIQLRDEKGNAISALGILQNITTLKLAAETIRKTHQLYREAISQADAVPYYRDYREEVYTFIGDGIENLTGYSATEITPSFWNKLIQETVMLGETVGIPSAEAGRRVRAGEFDKWRAEYRIQTKFGELRWLTDSAMQVRDDQGKVTGSLGFLQDITDRKLAIETLKQTHELYREAISQGNAVPYMLDFASRKYNFIGEGIKDLTGYYPTEITSEFWSKIVTDTIILDNKNGISVAEARKRSRSGEMKKWRADMQIHTRTGEIRWISDSSILLFDTQGKPTGSLGLLQDITDRKLAVETLNKTHQQYRQAIIQAGAVPYIHDHASHTFTFIGDGIYELTGYTAKEFDSRKLKQMIQETILFGETAGLTLEEAVDRTRADEFKKWRADYLIKTRTGKLKWIADSAIEIRDKQGNAVSSNGILQDITDRKKAEETLRDSYQRVRRALEGTVSAIAETVEKRDPYTAGHQRGVAKLAEAIATEMGLLKEQVDGIRVAATLHDIGKMYVPAEILAKPTKLTAIEFGLIKTHAQGGFDILKGIEFPWPIAQIVLQHHERLNGSGYSNGLTGEKIILEARIIAVADVVEAMTSHRPYRPKFEVDIALAEIEKNKDILYDPMVVETCINLFREKGFTFEGVKN
jgi:PAS domain S-box-containing protein/putative nucleotidyltransferase with HDIG domain